MGRLVFAGKLTLTDHPAQVGDLESTFDRENCSDPFCRLDGYSIQAIIKECGTSSSQTNLAIGGIGRTSRNRSPSRPALNCCDNWMPT